MLRVAKAIFRSNSVCVTRVGVVRPFGLDVSQAAKKHGSGNVHRSNAEALVDMVAPVVVNGNVATCDGGGGALGHPVEYIQLDRVNKHTPATCKYCQLRFFMSEDYHGH